MKLLRPSSSARGFSLIECLIYIIVLLVVFELALEAYLRTQTQTTRLARNASDIIHAVQTGEQWRDDVRQATGALRWLEAKQELQIPLGNRAIVYAFRDGAIWRSLQPGELGEKLLPAVKTSRMLEDKRREVTAWRWDLELATPQHVARVRPVFSFLAVPSGKEAR